MVSTTHSLLGSALFIHLYPPLLIWYCAWPCPFLLFHCFYISMLFHWLMLPYQRSYKIFNISPFWYYMYYMLDLWLDNIYLDKQDLQFIFCLIFWFFLGIFCKLYFFLWTYIHVSRYILTLFLINWTIQSHIKLWGPKLLGPWGYVTH